METLIDIKQEHYFPLTFRIFGIALLVSGAIAFSYTWLLVARIGFIAFMWILGVVLITTRYGLIINVKERAYTIYTWIIGFKVGTPNPISSIEKFYINSTTDNTTFMTRGGLRHNIEKDLYKAYMLLSNEEKIHVDSDKSIEKLESRLEKYQQITKSLMA